MFIFSFSVKFVPFFFFHCCYSRYSVVSPILLFEMNFGFYGFSPPREIRRQLGWSTESKRQWFGFQIVSSVTISFGFIWIKVYKLFMINFNNCVVLSGLLLYFHLFSFHICIFRLLLFFLLRFADFISFLFSLLFAPISVFRVSWFELVNLIHLSSLPISMETLSIMITIVCSVVTHIYIYIYALFGSELNGMGFGMMTNMCVCVCLNWNEMNRK